ncbi:hypothetical protein OHR68_19620 [Spirillospora sp. NBC_00431]
MIFNLIAIIISSLALGSSIYMAAQHARLMRRSNYLPAYLAYLSEFRSMEFNDRYRYVCESLRADHDPGLGLSGLPNDARRIVYDVAYFFQSFAVLTLLGLIDEEVVSTTNYRVVQVWQAIGPFVKREREVNESTGPYLLWTLEKYADRARL